jgi:hypothetical protein
MIIKVTALTNVTVNDPVGIETVSTFGNPLIQMDKNTYEEFEVLEQQGNRLIPVLEAAQTAGMLTFEVIRAPTGEGVAVEDEGISVEPACTTMDFVGPDVQAIAVGGGKVELHHPPPTYSPPLGSGFGALEWPVTTPGYVSRPSGGEGTPYFSGGLAVNTPGHPRLKTVDMSFFTAGLGVTHSSARVTNLHLGQIDVTIRDGNGNSESATLVLDPNGGDQIATIPSGRIIIRVLNTVTIGVVVEGEVHIWTDPVALLGLSQSGTGGYFEVDVNHTVAPTTADFGHAFWDDGAIPISIDPIVAPVAPVVVWVSGIRHFDTASTFRVQDSQVSGAQNSVNMSIDNDGDILLVDVSDFAYIVGEVAYDAATIFGLTFTGNLSPLHLDRPRYDQTFAVGAGDFLTANARARTTWHNFQGDEIGSPRESVAGIYQIDTADRSTDSIESYDRETYRLQNGGVSNFKQVITDYRSWYGGGGGADKRNWDATQSIATGTVGHIPGLQYRLGELVYPEIDFSTGYYFADFDYSSVVGACWAYRAFDVGDLLNHKAFTLTLEVTDIDVADIEVGLGGDDSTAVRIDVLFPGPERGSPNGSNDSVAPGSGWLHCGKVYNAPTFTGVDNDGCMQSISKIGDTITIDIVTGNMSSEYTQGTILVRIRYANGFTGKMSQTAVIGV